MEELHLIILNFLISCVIVSQTYVIETAKYNDCDKVPSDVLLETLGEAFNERYMSVTKPIVIDSDNKNEDGVKRQASVGEINSFYVNKDYRREIEEVGPPKYIGPRNSTKFKRESQMKRQWDCEAVTKWVDLGEDYFPPFIRAVECTRNNCWYGQFKCVPKAFTIKVLKKRKDRCLAKYGEGLMKSMRVQLVELWVWEERAVTFCCDCVP